MEMYEREYEAKVRASGGKKDANAIEDADEKLDEQSAAIEREMSALFVRLNALSHANYRPAHAHEEPEVIVNTLPVNMEEVGQRAATAPDEEMLAPEEIVERARRPLSSKEERNASKSKEEHRAFKRRRGRGGKRKQQQKAQKLKNQTAT